MSQTSRARRLARNRPEVEGLEIRALLALAGALDTSFGMAGKTNFSELPSILHDSLNPAYAYGTALSTVETSGTIVLASTAYVPATFTEYFTVEELNADGSPDTSFGQDGEGSFAVGTFLNGPGLSANSATSLVVQSNGTIDIGGCLGDQGTATTPSFGLIQITPTGTLDTTFGTNGMAILPALDANQEPFQALSAMALTSSGQLVVAGSAGTSTAGSAEFFAAEFNRNGTLETTFGTSGVTLVPVSINTLTIDEDTSVAVEPSGEIILAGNAASDVQSGELPYTFNDSAVVALTASGTLDTTFGFDGETLIPAVPSNPSTLGNRQVVALALQANGQIVLAETVALAGQDQSVSAPIGDLTRLNADGSLDTTFGDNGTATFTNGLTPGGVSVETDGEILVPGTVPSGTAVSALAGYTSSGTPDPTFGSPETPGLIVYFPGISAGKLTTASINDAGRIVLGGSITEDTVLGATYPDYEVIAAYATATITPVESEPPADFDGLGVSDIAVYLTTSGSFAYRPSIGGADVVEQFGIPGVGQTIPAPGDYDGSGQTELAAYLPSQGIYAYRPADGGPDILEAFGIAGPGQSIPAPADYFGTGVDDIAVYLPSIGAFGIRNPSGGPDEIVPFGTPGMGQSIPVPGDYFGTGQDDIAVYLTSIGAYAIRNPAGGTDEIIPFGIPGAGNSIPIPGDYDGSGKTELAVYLPQLGEFAYRPADGGPDVIEQFGAVGDGSIPDIGDYDGLGHDDIAIYDPNYADFAYRPTGGGPDVIVPFGAPGIGVSLPLAAPVSSNVTIAPGSVSALSEASSTVSSEAVQVAVTTKTTAPGGPVAKLASKGLVRVVSTLPAQGDPSKPQG